MTGDVPALRPQTLPDAWRNPAARRELLARLAAELNDAQRARGLGVTLRYLGAADEAALVRLSNEVTEATPFFARSFGLTPRQMAGYWRGLVRALLRDREAIVGGLFEDERLVGALSFGTTRFPGAWNGLRFAASLLWRAGLGGLVRVLRAVKDYERLLALAPADEGRTIRAVWLYVSPSVQGKGYGTALIETLAHLGALGFDRVQGAFDAEDQGLHRLYRRIGARFEREGTMSGHRVRELVVDLAQEMSRP